MTVPEIKTPTVNSEGLPSQQEPAAPIGASLAPVGAGLQKVAEGGFQAGMAAYAKAAETQARDRETKFLNDALTAVKEYHALGNQDAIGAYDQFMQSVVEARARHGNALTSHHALSLYENSSLRVLRYAQESMNGHFEREHKHYQLRVYNDGMESAARAVATLASTGEQGSRPALDVISKAFNTALDRAREEGLSGPNVEKFAKTEIHKVVDAFFKEATAKDSGFSAERLKAEAAYYARQGWMSVAAQRSVANISTARQIKQWVSGEIAGITRVDANGKPDASKGFIPWAPVAQKIRELDQQDPHYLEKVEGLEQAWAKQWRAHSLAGQELQMAVIARGQDAQGRFSPPVDSDVWQDLLRFHPERAKALRDAATRTSMRDYKYNKFRVEEVEKLAYAQVRHYLTQLTDAEIKELKPANITVMVQDQFMRNGGSGLPSPAHAAKLSEFLVREQKKRDPLERQFNDIASKILNEIHKGNQYAVKTQMELATTFLADTFFADPNKKPSRQELHDALYKEATTKVGGILGIGAKRLLETYRERRVQRSTAPAKPSAAPAALADEVDINGVIYKRGPDNKYYPKGGP